MASPWAHLRLCKLPTGGTCWPTCARPSSAGCTAPKPGSGACRCHLVTVGQERRPTATGRFRAARPNGPLALKAKPVGKTHYDEVRRRHLEGETLLGIARATGLALGTVRKYARAGSFPARVAHGPEPSILDPYLSHLERRLAEGCENGLALWRVLCGRGFPGGTRQVHRWSAERRTAAAKTGPHVRRIMEAGAQPPTAYDPVPALPTVPQLAWLLVQPAEALDTADVAIAARVE